MTLDKQGKEKIALLFGFILILGVVVVTFQQSQDTDDMQNEEINEPTQEQVDYNLISSTELQKKILAKEAVKIIDIRSKNEFDLEHIVHSLNIPIESIATASIDVNGDETLIIVGNKNIDIPAVIKHLNNRGFSNLSVLSGGILAWKYVNNPTITIGDPNSFVDQAKITPIAAEKLNNLINTGTKIYILDVRQSSKYNAGHLPGSVNIPLNELERRNEELPVNMEIIVYGDSDSQTFQAGITLYDLNYFTAYVLQGGIEDWKAKGFSIIN